MSDATRNDGNGGQQEAFVQMSALLTGFAADTIAPELDPVDLAGTLLQAARKGGGKAFDALLTQYEKLSGGKQVKDMTSAERQSIGNQLLGLDGEDQKPEVAATARSVIRLWYLGSWYPIDDGAEAETVVSDQAYIRGLAWKSMQSHAMGYSTWSYGYWAEKPPPLTDFTGNPEPSAAPSTVATGRPAAATPMVGQGKGGQSPACLTGEPHAADRTEGGS